MRTARPEGLRVGAYGWLLGVQHSHGGPASDGYVMAAARIRELVTKGAMGLGFILTTDDCQRTYEELRAKGVEFTEEPTEHFYAIDCGLRDPFGNNLRLTQPAPGPLEAPPQAT
jgi:uncharacterized glyoxalase superfamily protein PhnB